MRDDYDIFFWWLWYFFLYKRLKVKEIKEQDYRGLRYGVNIFFSFSFSIFLFSWFSNISSAIPG